MVLLCVEDFQNLSEKSEEEDEEEEEVLGIYIFKHLQP
jgi:hypothetical protein